jgi:Helix-turn-helix domain
MSRYRLVPSAAQEAVLLGHCAHARYVWNLCVEQQSHWRPGRGPMPGFSPRCRQLTEARANNAWLAEGSVIVQQQAIRDHDRAMAGFFAGTHRGRPDAPRQALDDRGPQLPFEARDLVRQRRLRHVQDRRGLRQRALFHDGDQALQRPHGSHIGDPARYFLVTQEARLLRR